MAKGPPESPLHEERPPAVDVQMFDGVMIPKTAPQAAFVITGIVTQRTWAEVAVDPSETRPKPETVEVSPTKSSAPEAKTIDWTN